MHKQLRTTGQYYLICSAAKTCPYYFIVLFRSENGLLSFGMYSEGKISVPRVSYSILAAGGDCCSLQCIDFLVRKPE